MVYHLAKKFRNVPELSLFTAKRNALIQKYERAGKRWFRITGADMPLTGHRNHALTTSLIQVVQEGWDYYVSETNWIQEYLEAVCHFEKKHEGVAYSSDDVIAIPGVASGWQLLHNVLLEPNDEIVVIEPAHYLAGPCSYMWYLGAKVIQVPSIEENDWEPDLEKLHASITTKTRAIVLDHPNNPTGAIYSAQARQTIIDIAAENDLPIISDELYRNITYDGNTASSMAKMSKDVPVIVMSSFSKFFMKPGWRIGYLCFHDPQDKLQEVKHVCRRIARSYGHNTTSIPLPILVAATRALREYTNISMEVASARSTKGPMDESKAMVRKLQSRRDYSFKRINEMDGISVVKAKASLYMFPKVHGIGKRWKTTEDFILDLLEKEAVVFNLGPMYGNTGFGHFRTMMLNDLSILEEVYNRLERFLLTQRS
jgi:aspartate/methionine/tyrosine aminotransferase